MTFAAELIGLAFLVAPGDVGLFVLPVPGFDEDHVVFADPDALLHLPGNACGALFPIGTAYFHAIRPEHVRDGREDLVVLGHPEVLPTAISVVAHGRGFAFERFNPLLSLSVRESDRLTRADGARNHAAYFAWLSTRGYVTKPRCARHCRDRALARRHRTRRVRESLDRRGNGTHPRRPRAGRQIPDLRSVPELWHVLIASNTGSS